MKFATFTMTAVGRSSLLRNFKGNQGWWVRFGDDILLYAANNRFDSIVGKMPRGAREKAGVAGSIKKGNMHLVVQKGRIFQNENPDVRVILDKGRYLVVDLPRSAAKALNKRSDPCFHIEPLRENQTVFSKRTRTERIGHPDQRLMDIVSGIQISSYEDHLVQLVSYPTRFSSSDHFTAAANWAMDQFTDLGLSGSVSSITVPGHGDSANVIARKPGYGENEKKNILVVAHLDSVNHPGGPTAIAPGADDNASGSAAVLTLAAALSSSQFVHDITFILFGGEEQGLHGSKQYLSDLSDTEKASIHSVLNMDMIGSLNATPPTVLLEGSSISQWMMDALEQSALVHTSLEIQTSLSPFGSDHMPFLDAQIPAVLTIEGTDSANSAIHTDQDTIHSVDTAFAMQILRMNLGYVADQAEVVVQDEQDCGCSGAGVEAKTSTSIGILAGHFHGLFAQYARLHREGLINEEDYQSWKHAQEAHDAIVEGSGLPKTSDR